MRRLWVGFGFVLVATVGVGLSTTRTIGQPPAGGDKDANHRKITVTGVGTVTVKPDTARLSFSVKASGGDFKTAVAECDKKGAAVEKAIADLKLSGLEVKKGPIHLISTRASTFFPPQPFIMPPMPVVPQPLPAGVPGVPGPVAVAPVKGLAVAFVNAQVNPPQPVPVNPLPLVPLDPLVQPVRPAIQPGQPGVGAPPIGQPGQPGAGGFQPGLQPFPGPIPGQPFPGMMGAGVEVVRSYTVVASFGAPGLAGELADIVKVTDKLQTAIVGAGGTESPVFMNVPAPVAGLNHGMPAHGAGIVKIEFHRAHPATARQEALKLAVTDALTNAKVAAGVANLTTKDVVALTEQNPLRQPGGAATGRGEVLGETEITVQVSVTFSY